MTEEEAEVNEDIVVPNKPDFLAGDSIDLGEDDLMETELEDDSLSLSFGGSRGFEE